MFKNYLTVAVRNIQKHKAYSFINIAGLAIGMACCILILMWVQDEVGTDRFHINGQSIHRVIVERTVNNAFRTPVTPSALGPALQRDYPEIIDSARLLSTYQSLRYGKDQDRIYNERGFMADPSFFQMFTFPLLAGEAISVLKDPSSIVMPESMASYLAEQRTREIGIRKVMGSSAVGIVIELNREFLK